MNIKKGILLSFLIITTLIQFTCGKEETLAPTSPGSEENSTSALSKPTSKEPGTNTEKDLQGLAKVTSPDELSLMRMRSLSTALGSETVLSAAGGLPPQFNPPTPCEQAFNILVGNTFTFLVNASDPDPGDIVTLEVVHIFGHGGPVVIGPPPGATVTPPLPASGNPVQTTFSWTPTVNELGWWGIRFVARDKNGNKTACIVGIDVRLPAEIGDFVWCDLNDDGVQDPGEPGIPGVKVDLTCDNVFIGSQTTDANGGYLFTNLLAGNCVVTVDPSTTPPGKEVGQCPTTVNVNLQFGQSFLDADFCFKNSTGEIGDFVWCDLNDDGIQDPGEPGIAGVKVDLTCDGNFIGSQTTDANGNYLFTNVPAGNCDVTVDLSTIPAGKEVGQCPTTVNVNLQAGQSFLDADFCFKNSAPKNCCENGNKIGALTMLYTGEDCSATSHSQDPSKVSCSGDPNFAAQVQILATDKSDPNSSKAKVWFNDIVDLNTTFDIDAGNAGQGKLKAKTFVHIFDLNGNTLQTIEFHTSCSQPLFTGDQFGSLVLIDCEPEGGGGGKGLCELGKPQVLDMRYTGEDCSATNHSQDPSKVSCSGDPNFAASVVILVTDKSDPNSSKAKAWFNGPVNLNGNFNIDATNAGENKLKANTWVHIFDLNGGTLQTIQFHTSCSQPLNLGDQFGSLVLDGFTPE